MKKFINHVDHVVWLSREENLEKNIAQLEAVTDASLERHDREDMQAAICVDWNAGLEVVAPIGKRCELNEALYARLDSHGEGLLAMVWAVEDLEEHKKKLEAKGMEIGPLMEDLPSAPWTDKIILRERFAPPVINSWVVLSQIDYHDNVIKFVEVREKVA